jgi:hypothetical protein
MNYSLLFKVRRFRALNAPKDSTMAPKSKGNLLVKGGGAIHGALKNGTVPHSDCYSALYGFDVLNVTLSSVHEFPSRLQIKQAKSVAIPFPTKWIFLSRCPQVEPTTFC